MKFLSSLEQLFYGRVALQPIFESMHRIALRGKGYMQSQSVAETGEINAIRYALSTYSQDMSTHILDVGANRGQFLQLVLQNLPLAFEVHCFEPSSDAFHHLQNYFSSKRNVYLYNLDLSSQTGSSRLYNAGTVFGTTYPMDESFCLPEKIKMSTLDEFCNDRGIDSVFYLKIDVEGGEFDVLNGGRNLLKSGLVKFLQFEYGPNHIKSKCFMRHFYELLSHYRIYRILKDGLRLLPYHEIIEVPMPANFLAELVE